jgi:cytochrome b pre-mRNA-processing protein 3
MIFRLFRRPPRPASIASLYGMIVAQARAPAFYRDYGVPDTVSGRLEMVILHAVLLLLSLEGGGEAARALGQQLFDEFCRDMDASLREMGVGDLAVPRKMRELGEAFYGRQAAYRAALGDADRRALAQALARNVFAGASADASERLAAYVREVASSLAAQDGIARGELRFPDPERIAAGA